MSSCSILRIAIGLGCISAVAVAAVAEGPPADKRDTRNVPTRIIPPAQRTDGQQSAPSSSPRGDETDRVVVVEPRSTRQERELWDWARRHRELDAPGFGGPFVAGCGYGPFSAPWAIADAYFSGRYDERYERRRWMSETDMQRRRERLWSRHGQALSDGLDLLAAGDAARAVVQLTLAAQLDQGDPACRIHLAQARLALGHYAEAAEALRRALQLQPKLLYVPLDLDRYYAEPGTLDRLTDVLSQRARTARVAPEVQFLQGFLEYQRGEFGTAYAALRTVARALPKDDLTRSLLEICKPAGPE